MTENAFWKIPLMAVTATVLFGQGVPLWLVFVIVLVMSIGFELAIEEHKRIKSEQSKPFENRAARRAKPIRSRDHKNQPSHKDVA